MSALFKKLLNLKQMFMTRSGSIYSSADPGSGSSSGSALNPKHWNFMWNGRYIIVRSYVSV